MNDESKKELVNRLCDDVVSYLLRKSEDLTKEIHATEGSELYLITSQIGAIQETKRKIEEIRDDYLKE